jgi:phage-related protein
MAGLPFVKPLRGEIWELRPLRDRVLFAAWVDGSFVLLHHFRKDTNKTPIREIEQAERNLADLKKRSNEKKIMTVGVLSFAKPRMGITKTRSNISGRP